jgi:Ser/Thr protein kinase RdoA (MazF antagonist)
MQQKEQMSGGATANLQEAERMLAEQYGLLGQLLPLPGEHDQNFAVLTANGRSLFKVHAAALSEDRAGLQAAVLRHLEQDAPDLPLPRLFLGRDGRLLASATDSAGNLRRLRLTTWLDGSAWVDAAHRGAHSAQSLGKLLGRLDRSLARFHHPAGAEPYAWDLANAAARSGDAALIVEPDRRDLAETILHRFASEVAPRLSTLPKQVIHGDANDRNVLLDAEGLVSGLIDFGDMVESWRVNELAVAAAYVAIGADAPLDAIEPLVAAYCAENPLGATEADVLFDLILTRYAVSMAMAARQSREQPENAYLKVSQDDIWQVLQAMRDLNRSLAVARLRHAAGHEPIAERRGIDRWIMRNAHRFGPVLPLPMRSQDLTVLPLGADRDRGAGHYAQRLDAVLPGLDGIAVGR